MTPTPPTIDAPERRAKRTADHAGWIDQRALEIAQGIAAEEGITDVQTIARIQIGAIEGIKSRMAASSGERGAALEAAARVAETFPVREPGPLSPRMIELMQEHAEEIATAIRALATPATWEEPKL